MSNCTECRNLRAEILENEAVIRVWRGRVIRAEEKERLFINSLHELSAENKRLREMLRKYGAHTDECLVNKGLERGCNCGFSDSFLKYVIISERT